MAISHNLAHLRPALWLCTLIFCARFGASLAGQEVGSSSPVVIDRVVAVVNDRPILSSDLHEEMLLSVLEPSETERGTESPQEALQRLISRTLIRQQIRQEDVHSVEPTDEEVQQRIAEIRKVLPLCVQDHCTTDAGWEVFLATHGLTQARVRSYVRGRMQILRFIEMRFRQGIQISQQEIETYYHDSLVPQYQKGQPVPALDVVAPRIQEILLQQQVSEMFGGWLDSLRKQGEVEVLDPSLEAAGDLSQGGATSP